MSVHQPEIRLLICVLFHHRQGAVYGAEDLSKGDIIWWEGKYVMVKSLVVQKIHGVVHGGSNLKSGRNNVVGMRFKGVQVDLGGRQMVEDANKTLDVLRGLRNQISSSAHSGVVRRHVELF